MAMIAVELVLEKLATFVQDEANLLRGVRDGISELEDDLHSMKCFLQDAEARSESDQGAKAWVTQVRDVAYDAEDAVEKFMLRLAPTPAGHGFVHSIRKSYSYFPKLRQQHQLAVQIRSIKTRVKAISERRNAFSFNRVDMEPTSSSAAPVRWLDNGLNSLYVDEADVVGIEDPKHQLITWLVEGEAKLTSVSVVGMGGLGKTTLVKKVFDSQPARRCFDCHAWVTVSRSFTCIELLRAAMEGFGGATDVPAATQRIESMNELQLVGALRKHLQNKRYVVVFDDVWSVDAWEAIKCAFPDHNLGSRIIFTTRIHKLPASIENPSRIYHLKPLPAAESWDLFCKKAFRGERDGVCPEELKELSRRILKKCEGLPLAIVAIGGLLSTKNKHILEWKTVHDRLATELKSDNNLGNLGRILLLSYTDLPYNLKVCYLYLSTFPEDYLITRMKLVRLWVVEGFVEEKQGFTLEEVAEKYLNELVSRSMIQVIQMNYFNRVRTCRVHDLMREIIQLKCKEESFAMIVDERTINTNEKVRRLSIHGNKENIPSAVRFPYLRSLMVFSWTDTFTSSGHACFRGFRLLRVLELEGAPLINFPPELVELIHLRYLSLRRTMITELPDSIKKLKNLKILDLKRSLVSSMPMGILHLTRLCQLRNYRYSFPASTTLPETHGMTVPSGIGRLVNLEKLGSIEVHDANELVRELGKLTQLRRLGILKLKEEHGMDLCRALEKMKHLNSLYLVSTNENEFLHLDSLLPPPQYLQKLYLKCNLSALPAWIASLQYLSRLVLQYSNLKTDPLKSLQKLPSLVLLELRQAYDEKELCCDSGGFLRLKELNLHLLQSLQCIRLAEGAMTGLRRLRITECKNLEMIPLGIEHLKDIEELILCDVPSKLYKSIDPVHGEDYCKVEHIPSVTHIYETYWRWVAETRHASSGNSRNPPSFDRLQHSVTTSLNGAHLAVSKTRRRSNDAAHHRM